MIDGFASNNQSSVNEVKQQQQQQRMSKLDRNVLI